MLRKVLTWVSGPALAVFFLWLCFRDVSLDELGSHILRTDPLLLVLSIATIPLHLMTRAWRWRTLMRPVSRSIPYIELLSAVSIGYMASLLPGRVGEVLRPALLSRRTRLPFAPTLASVGVERAILDLLALLSCGALALLMPVSITGLGTRADPELISQLRYVGGIALGCALIALVVTAVVARHRLAVQLWIETRAAAIHNRVVRAILRWLASLFPGLGAFESVRGIVRLAVETAVIWFVIGVGVQWGIRACGVDLPPGGWLMMLPILAIGIGVPTPGGTGTYHLAMKIGLVSLFAAEESAALGAGIVVHAIAWVPGLAMGGAFVARGGLVRTGGGTELEVVEEAAS